MRADHPSFDAARPTGHARARRKAAATARNEPAPGANRCMEPEFCPTWRAPSRSTRDFAPIARAAARFSAPPSIRRARSRHPAGRKGGSADSCRIEIDRCAAGSSGAGSLEAPNASIRARIGCSARRKRGARSGRRSASTRVEIGRRSARSSSAWARSGRRDASIRVEIEPLPARSSCARSCGTSSHEASSRFRAFFLARATPPRRPARRRRAHARAAARRARPVTSRRPRRDPRPAPR